MKNTTLELLHEFPYKYILTAMFLIAVAAFIRYLIMQRKFEAKVKKIRKKIYNNWIDNPSVNIIRVEKEYTLSLSDKKLIEIYIKVISSSTSLKPRVVNPTPFLKPFPEGVFIDSLSDYHLLLYNGFPLMKYHCLVTTKQFVPQNAKLTREDFSSTLLAMKAAIGFAFYNSSPNAGSSQGHKHLQIIPYSAFRYGYLPIDSLIKLRGNIKNQLFTLPEYKFKHIFYMFPRKITSKFTASNLVTRGKLLEQQYENMLKYLANEDGAIAYNVIITSEWMFLVLRTKELVKDTIKVNALGFTGSFIVKNDKDLKLFPTDAPLDILLDVTYPMS